MKQPENEVERRRNQTRTEQSAGSLGTRSWRESVVADCQDGG